MSPLDIKIHADGDPQKTNTRWRAKLADTGEEFLVGYTVPFKDGDGAHRGLTQTKILNKIPKLYYDRTAAAAQFGLWGQFIWPTVVAESAGGHHLLVNSYDRARFTFGFYQLAAHTPDDNLILLFRKLMTLAGAAVYFPDLSLKSGELHRTADDKTYSLETVTTVHRPNGKIEDQLVGFMTYLNPDTTTAGDAEALNTAKLMHWLVNDPAAVSASVETAMAIMRRKAKRLATAYDLLGKPPELAIWVSDIMHQGRGGKTEIKAALAKSTMKAKLAALFEIGSGEPGYDGRRETVRACVATLIEEKVFDGVVLGDGKLPMT